MLDSSHLSGEPENNISLLLDKEFSSLVKFLDASSSDVDPFVRLCVLTRCLELRRIKDSLNFTSG